LKGVVAIGVGSMEVDERTKVSENDNASDCSWDSKGLKMAETFTCSPFLFVLRSCFFFPAQLVSPKSKYKKKKKKKRKKEGAVPHPSRRVLQTNTKERDPIPNFSENTLSLASSA
jgi:hypothetical protein